MHIQRKLEPFDSPEIRPSTPQNQSTPNYTTSHEPKQTTINRKALHRPFEDNDKPTVQASARCSRKDMHAFMKHPITMLSHDMYAPNPHHHNTNLPAPTPIMHGLVHLHPNFHLNNLDHRLYSPEFLPSLPPALVVQQHEPRFSDPVRQHFIHHSIDTVGDSYNDQALIRRNGHQSVSMYSADGPEDTSGRDSLINEEQEEVDDHSGRRSVSSAASDDSNGPYDGKHFHQRDSNKCKLHAYIVYLLWLSFVVLVSGVLYYFGHSQIVRLFILTSTFLALADYAYILGAVFPDPA